MRYLRIDFFATDQGLRPEMRKIAILAIVCLATACGDVSGEVWFVPGWRTGFSSRDGCVRILKDIYPGQNIRVCSWDSLQPWQTAVRNSREFTGKLNQEIMRLDHSRRRDIILVGHSIGGEIVLEILSRLAGHKMSIHSAAILGGAVPCDDPRIVQALHAVRFHISNVYDPGDWVLKYLYPLGNSRVVPLGLAGWAGSDPRFLEISASGKKSSFYNHYAYLYLEVLAKMPDKHSELLETAYIEPFELRRPADTLFWNDLETVGSWKLQTHYDGTSRILDPYGVRRAAGTRQEMENLFTGLKAELKKAVPR